MIEGGLRPPFQFNNKYYHINETVLTNMMKKTIDFEDKQDSKILNQNSKYVLTARKCQ